MIKAMDEVGVDGALLISVFAMYRWDASYAVSVHKQFPNRFALIKPVNPNDPKVGETIEEWAKMDGTVAVRIMMNARGLDRSGRSRHQQGAGDGGQERPAGQPDGARPAGAGGRARQAQSRHDAGDRPSRARAADEAAGAQGAVGRAAQAARAGAAQEHRGQDQRRLHAQPRAVPLQGHPPAGRARSSTRSASIAACGAPTGRAR